MSREEILKTLIERLGRMSGGATKERVAKISALSKILPIEKLQLARFEECSDEKTGRRYGNAKCRYGKCLKVGHTTFKYQLWLVWN